MTRTVEAVYDGAVLRPETASSWSRTPASASRWRFCRRPRSRTASFLHTAHSLELQGPVDWSANLDNYLYGDDDQPRG